MLRMRGVNDYEWLLIGGWTTRSMGVVITEMENIELRVDIFFAFVFWSVFEGRRDYRILFRLY